MIDNKMSVDQINLKEWLGSLAWPTVQPITQEEYDLLQTKDLSYIYIITDSRDGRMYAGESLIVRSCADRTYLVGPSDTHGEYTVWLNEKEGWQDRLIEICRFNDPQSAINAINHFNRVGSHHQLDLQLYNALTSYIDKDINVHDLLIGIISLFGYRDDIRLQHVIQMVIEYESHNTRDISVHLRDALPTFSRTNHLWKFYSDLYDLVIKYNYFKGREFHPDDPDDLNLSEPIRNIFNIFIRIR